MWGTNATLLVYDPDYMKMILGRSGENETWIVSGAGLPSMLWNSSRDFSSPAFPEPSTKHSPRPQASIRPTRSALTECLKSLLGQFLFYLLYLFFVVSFFPFFLSSIHPSFLPSFLPSFVLPLPPAFLSFSFNQMICYVNSPDLKDNFYQIWLWFHISNVTCPGDVKPPQAAGRPQTSVFSVALRIVPIFLADWPSS